MGFLMDNADLKKLIVQSYLDNKSVIIRKWGNNKPGKECLRSFKKRYSIEIAVRKP